MTAVAGGVLAVTAFLGGAAVGHAWTGTPASDTGPIGPGGGRFGNDGLPGGPVPGQGAQPQTGQGTQPQTGQGTQPQTSQGTQPQTGQAPRSSRPSRVRH